MRPINLDLDGVFADFYGTAGLQPYRSQLRILSARPRPTGYLVSVAQDKRDWVKRVLAPDLQVITVDHGAAKAQFAAPGDILIDDLERNIRAWEAAGGIGILHHNAASTLAQLRRHLSR